MKGVKILNIFDKKIVVLMTLFLATVFLFGFINTALALDVGLDFLTATGLGTTDIRIIIGRIIQIALGLLAIIALIIILYGGFIWMTSGGQPEKIERAKRILVNAVIGLIIILLSLSIVTFIINSILQAMFLVAGPPTPPPWTGCVNCGTLGGGIIESVYPEPGAKDVPRNTGIFVTFKEDMDANTIIDGGGTLGDIAGPAIDDPNVKIYITAEGEDGTLRTDEVTASRASLSEFRTFKFKPKNYLGDGINRIWYTVKLEDDIQKADGSSAFPGVPGYFSWSFEVGTLLDFDPPYVENVFPPPDNNPDEYTTTDAQQASGTLTVVGDPNIEEEAEINPTRLLAANHSGGLVSDADVAGEYSCSVDGGVCIYYDNTDLDGDPAEGFEVTGRDGTDCTASLKDIPGLNPNPSLNIDYIDLGCGMRLLFDDLVTNPLADGQQWWFTVTASKEADILRIANKSYKFVDDSPGANEITRALGDPVATAQNIADKVEADRPLSPDVSVAYTTGTAVITFTAVKAGESGNNIAFDATGNWATLDPDSGYLEGGVDEGLIITVNPPPDQPRNAIIRIDFSEAMDPTAVSGTVATDGSVITDSVGNLTSTDFDKITIQIDYDGLDDDNFDDVDDDDDLDGDPSTIPAGESFFDEDEYVAGRFEISNMYRTIEFIPARVCTDEFGSAISNSCGDLMYCLPTDSDGEAAPYLITIKAASLESVSLSLCDTDTDSICDSNCGEISCDDSNYPDVLNTLEGNECVCGNSGTGEYFPVAGIPLDGTVDAQGNSLNGNWDYDTNTWGPGLELPNPPNQSNAPAFNLNDDPLDPSKGDSLLWSFYINEKIDLAPPVIEDVTPDPREENVSLVDDLEAKFSKLLMSSTLRPDNSYQDGYCYCNNSTDCLDGQSCVDNRCVDQDSQRYCLSDEECSTGFCQNKEYYTLINNPTKPSGYWITSYGVDEDPSPNGDGWDDKTVAVLNHTPFVQFFNYGARAGSGIKNIYQNCYLPSIGEECPPALPGSAVSCVTVSCEQLGGVICDGDGDDDISGTLDDEECIDISNNRFIDYVYSTVDTSEYCCLPPGSCQ